MEEASNRPRSQKMRRPLPYYETDQSIALDVAGSSIRPRTAPMHDPYKSEAQRETTRSDITRRVFLDQRALVTRARTKYTNDRNEKVKDPLRRTRLSKHKSKKTKQLKSNSFNMEPTSNEAQGNDVLDSSNTTTFKPAGKLGDGPTKIDDEMALELGRQVLSGLDSTLADKTAYKTSRYFIDQWLADLGSSAEEADPLSVNLLSKFDSFKMDQVSLWIKEKVGGDSEKGDTPEVKGFDSNSSTNEDDRSLSSDETSSIPDNSVNEFENWETAPLDQRGYALVAVESLDTMCMKLAPVFPVLQEIRRALYPCLFLENGEAFHGGSNTFEHVMSKSVEDIEDLDRQKKQREPYTSRKFFFEGASNEENLRRAAEALAAKAQLETMREQVNAAKRVAVEARLAKEAAEDLRRKEETKVEGLQANLMEAAVEKERLLAEIQKHRNDKRSLQEQQKNNMEAFKKRERETAQINAGDMEQKLKTLQEQYKAAEANFVKTDEALKELQKEFETSRDAFDLREVDMERKVVEIQAELDKAIAQRKRAIADAAQETERTGKLHRELQVLQSELDSRTNGASKLIRQIEEMEVSRLARESEIEKQTEEMRAGLNISWQSKLNEANISLQELQEKLKAQEEITSEQRGKIWDRDGRLEDAAETLKATTEKLQNRIELLEHLVDGRNADIERLKEEATDMKQRATEAEAALQPTLDELERYRREAVSAKQDADSRARAEAEAKAAADAAAGHSKDLHDKARKLTPLHKAINKLKNKHTKATLEQTTDCLYDIYEKKLIADEADERSGREKDSLADFLNDYFLHMYGLQKMANNKMGDFLLGCLKYKDKSKRIFYFLVQLGLERPTLYSRNLGDLMCLSLGRMFEDNLRAVKEMLDEGTEALQVSKAIHLVIGASAVRSEPTTWLLPQLARIATPSMIDLLLVKIEGLAGDGPPLVDLDDVIGLIMDHCLEWYSDAQRKIAQAFLEYDEDRNGFELPDFNGMLKTLCRIDLSERELNKLWSGIANKVGADSGVIQDGDLFSICCCYRDVLPFKEWPEGSLFTKNIGNNEGGVATSKRMKELEKELEELTKKNDDSQAQLTLLEKQVQDAAASGISTEAARLLEERNETIGREMEAMKEEARQTNSKLFASFTLDIDRRNFYTADIEAQLERTQEHLEGLEHLYEVHHEHEVELTQEVSTLKHKNHELEGILNQVQDKLRDMVRFTDAHPECQDLVSSSLAELKRKDFINESFKANYLVTKMQRTWRRNRQIKMLAENAIDGAISIVTDELIKSGVIEHMKEQTIFQNLDLDRNPTRNEERVIIQTEAANEIEDAEVTAGILHSAIDPANIERAPTAPMANSSVAGVSPISQIDVSKAKAGQEARLMNFNETNSSGELPAEKVDKEMESGTASEGWVDEAKVAKTQAALEAKNKIAANAIAAEAAAEARAAEAESAAAAAAAEAAAAKQQAEEAVARQIAELKAQLEAATAAAAAATATAKAEAEERHRAEEAAAGAAVKAAAEARKEAEAKAQANIEAAEAAAAKAKVDAEQRVAEAAAAIAHAHAQGDADATAALEAQHAQAAAMAEEAAAKAAADMAAAAERHARDMTAAKEIAMKAHADAASSIEAAAAEAAAAHEAHESAILEANMKAAAEVAAAQSAANEAAVKAHAEHEKTLIDTAERAAAELAAAKAASEAREAAAQNAAAYAESIAKLDASEARDAAVRDAVAKAESKAKLEASEARDAAVRAAEIKTEPKANLEESQENAFEAAKTERFQPSEVSILKQQDSSKNPNQAQVVSSVRPSIQNNVSKDMSVSMTRESTWRESSNRPLSTGVEPQLVNPMTSPKSTPKEFDDERIKKSQSPPQQLGSTTLRRSSGKKGAEPPVSAEVRIAVRHKNTKVVLEASRSLSTSVAKLEKLESKKSNPAIAKQIKALQKKAEGFRNDIDAHGGWRVALYRDDGSINIDFDVKPWRERDKIDILSEIRGYVTRKFQEASQNADREAQKARKDFSRHVSKIKHLEKEANHNYTRLRQLEEDLEVANASLEEHERMDYGQLARKLGDRPSELLPHLLKRMLQERIAAVTLLKAISSMEEDLQDLCRLPEDEECATKHESSELQQQKSPFSTPKGYAKAISKATSALVSYRVMPIESYSILQKIKTKTSESSHAVGSGRAVASMAASKVYGGARSGASAGLQPKHGLAGMPPHIQAAGGYGELLENAASVDLISAMKAINYQMNTEYLHHAEKVEAMHHLVQARILFGDRWNEHWDTYENMDEGDRSRIENAARKMNVEFLRHQRAANTFNDRLGQLLEARGKVALETIEQHYLERIKSDKSASSAVMQWAEHQSKVLKNSDLAPIRSSSGSAPAFASLREYRNKGKRSRWGLASLS